MTFISIAIPTWEYNGKGAEVLRYSFEKMETQTFKNFNVVISDHSKDDEIKNLCESWQNKLDIKYYPCEEGRGIVAYNLNNAIRHCDGEWIKLLDQDDYFFDNDALAKTAEYLTDTTNWVATAYLHTKNKLDYFNYHQPSLNKYLCICNTIGTCSCVTLRNIEGMPLLDTKLTYAHDCDYFFRYLLAYGLPKFIDYPTIVNFLWENSITSTVTPELINRENKYILAKYGGN